MVIFATMYSYSNKKLETAVEMTSEVLKYQVFGFYALEARKSAETSGSPSKFTFHSHICADCSTPVTLKTPRE